MSIWEKPLEWMLDDFMVNLFFPLKSRDILDDEKIDAILIIHVNKWHEITIFV